MDDKLRKAIRQSSLVARTVLPARPPIGKQSKYGGGYTSMSDTSHERITFKANVTRRAKANKPTLAPMPWEKQ